MDNHTASILEIALQAMERAAPGSGQDFLKLLSEETALRIARCRFDGDDALARHTLTQLAIHTARIVMPAAND